MTRNEQIIALRQSGLWPTQIAKQLGISRNVVIGVCFRAGLSSADTDKGIPHKLMVRRGEDCPFAKLTEDAVRSIRRDYLPWSRTNGALALAKHHGVDPSTINDVIYRRAWAHVA